MSLSKPLQPATLCLGGFRTLQQMLVQGMQSGAEEAGGTLAQLPFPPRLAWVWGAAFMDGLLGSEGRLPGRREQVLACGNRDALALMQACEPCVVQLWEMLEAYAVDEALVWPGELEYMVVNPLGQLVSDCLLVHKALPDRVWLTRTIDRLLNNFLGRDLHPLPVPPGGLLGSISLPSP